MWRAVVVFALALMACRRSDRSPPPTSGTTGTATARAHLVPRGTPPFLDHAFHDATVQGALATNELYKSSYPARCVLVAPTEPPAVAHAREVLHGVLTNRAELCP